MSARRSYRVRRPILPLIRWPDGDHRLKAEDAIDEGEGTVVAKGAAVPRTEADLAELAIVTDQDREEAAEDWREKTMPTYAGLIDATEEE